MRTVTKTVYSFNELSQEAQQKAILNLSNINLYYGWWEYVYYEANEIGLKITSFDLDRNKHANGEFLLSASEVAANIIKLRQETEETYQTAKSFLEDFNPVFASYMDENSEDYESREIEEKLQELENDFLSSLLEDYANILQNEYEYLYSDEAIKETIEANKYEFNEDGTIA